MPFVQRALAGIKPGEGNTTSDLAVQEALGSAFKELDDALVKSAAATIESDLLFPEKVRRLEPGFAGFCALLILYDPSTSSLHVTSTGDCRVVLGRRTTDGKWEAIPLAVDQTCGNLDEIARIQNQFPDKPDIVQGGQFWGVQPSRTFGDGNWKWDKGLRQKLRVEYNGSRVPDLVTYKNYKKGPYLTLSPVVKTTKISRGGPPSFFYFWPQMVAGTR
jgi:pyruvate dehydrogenase phosphatase